jgi:hypothetical protein
MAAYDTNLAKEGDILDSEDVAHASINCARHLQVNTSIHLSAVQTRGSEQHTLESKHSLAHLCDNLLFNAVLQMWSEKPGLHIHLSCEIHKVKHDSTAFQPDLSETADRD